MIKKIVGKVKATAITAFMHEVTYKRGFYLINGRQFSDKELRNSVRKRKAGEKEKITIYVKN